MRGGVLMVSGGERIAIATREAVVGDDLVRLEAEVLEAFRRKTIEEQSRPGRLGASPAGCDAPDLRLSAAGARRRSTAAARPGCAQAEGVMAKEQDHRNNNSLAEPVRRQRARRERWRREGERPLGHNLAMIGVLGWLVVTPTLIGIFVGRWLDRIAEQRDLLDREPPVRRPLPRLLAGVEAGQPGMSGARLTEVLRDGAPFVLLGALLGAAISLRSG